MKKILIGMMLFIAATTGNAATIWAAIGPGNDTASGWDDDAKSALSVGVAGNRFGLSIGGIQPEHTFKASGYRSAPAAIVHSVPIGPSATVLGHVFFNAASGARVFGSLGGVLTDLCDVAISPTGSYCYSYTRDWVGEIGAGVMVPIGSSVGVVGELGVHRGAMAGVFFNF